jgi:hypothetical protein
MAVHIKITGSTEGVRILSLKEKELHMYSLLCMLTLVFCFVTVMGISTAYVCSYGQSSGLLRVLGTVAAQSTTEHTSLISRMATN